MFCRVYVCTLHGCFMHMEVKRDIRLTATGVTEGCKLATYLGPLQEHQELSQPLLCGLNKNITCGDFPLGILCEFTGDSGKNYHRVIILRWFYFWLWIQHQWSHQWGHPYRAPPLVDNYEFTCDRKTLPTQLHQTIWIFNLIRTGFWYNSSYFTILQDTELQMDLTAMLIKSLRIT